MRQELWRQAALAVEQGRSAALLRRLERPATLLLLDGAPALNQETEPGASVLKELPASGGYQRFRTNEGTFFYQPLRYKFPLVVCGAGHVGYYVAAMGRMLGFDVTVIDEREEWLTAERFPDCRRLLGDYQKMLDALPRREDSFFIIATYGHQRDLQCLEQIMEMPTAYTGLLGSRRKVSMIREHLVACNVSQERIDALHTPIGLPIGGDTPAEIAVSIAAQLIQCRSQHGGTGYLGDELLKQWKERQARVVITVVDKEGSGPQIPGAVMTYNRDGSISGTIGGGRMELEACCAAEKMQSGTILQEYDMHGERLCDSDLVCGGNTQLFLEVVEE